MVRLAHFSDIHIGSPRLEWALADWFSKRTTSWINDRFLGRGKRFAAADEVTACLMDELLTRDIDHIVFSGDATVLGFESEIRRAAELTRVNAYPIPALAIPGNHDYCTRSAAATGHFERYFAPWLTGRRIGEHTYPFAQKVGPVWLIGVNAATGNRLPWDASGTVGADQLKRLQQLLASLDGGVKILVVHFPIRLATGCREPSHHGLRDLDAVLAVAAAAGVQLWLHGHRHSPYFLAQPIPSICAGTATQRDIWSYGEYTIDGMILQAARRIYDPVGRCFRDAETFTLTLK